MYFSPEKNTVFNNHSEIRSAFSNISLPVDIDDQVLGSLGVFNVVQTAPVFDPMTQRAVQLLPVLSANGAYEQQWEIVPLNASEQEHAKTSLISSITLSTQARLDNFARTRNYDGILSACTYATSTVPKFAAEGQYCVNARDSTWAALYTILAEVEAGTRPMPSGFADVETELPVLTWPV